MRSRPPASWPAALLLALVPAPATAAVVVPTAFSNEVIGTGLDQPTSLAFLPDGRFLVTEQRSGKVRVWVGDHVAATDPALTVPDLIAVYGEQGLQSVAVDPNWPALPYIYLCYTRTGNTLRLVRYTGVGDVDAPDGENLTFADPLLLMDDIPDDSPNHQGGGLRFGSDGMLYFSLGEDESPCSAADSSSLRGEILRLDVSGLPPGGGPQVPRAWITPGDNPLSTTDPNARLVWAFGLRNPWRFDVDPVTGVLYVADVGAADVEEIDEVEPGDFLGWPWREGYLIKAPPGCPEPGGIGTMPFKEPIVAWERPPGAVAITCGGIYRPFVQGGAAWPLEYDGNVFYGEYYSGFIRRVQKTDSTWESPPPVEGQPTAENWASGLTTLSDLHFGPDGNLWYVRSYDPVYSPSSGTFGRIRFRSELVSVPAQPPGALALRAAPNPFAGRVHLSFHLDAPGRVRVDVLDVAGRRVARVMDAWAPAGETRIRWDGVDDAGRQVPPGLYLARIARGGQVETVRILRTR